MNSPQGANAPVKKAPWFPANGAEARICITGFLLLFCVLGGYFAVRPVRETIGTVIGREATQNLWFFTALFAIVIVPFYGWLVAPLRAQLKTPLLGIVPNGILHYVPFAALGDGGRVLADDFGLFSLPSASTLQFVQQKRKSGPPGSAAEDGSARSTTGSVVR